MDSTTLDLQGHQGEMGKRDPISYAMTSQSGFLAYESLTRASWAEHFAQMARRRNCWP
jgi:hypothetical protein